MSGKRVGGAAAYRRCAEAGMTKREASDHLGVQYEWLVRVAKRGGIQFVSGQKQFAARHPEVRMKALRKAWEAHA